MKSNTTKQPAAETEAKRSSGAVLVCGAGVAGIQASLDLSAAGFRVYLIEETPSIGGGMARLDKTFPTGDCATCIISPKLVECVRDLNVDIYTMADVTRLDGQCGHFSATVRQRPRYVNAEKCTGCGECWTHCPVSNISESVPTFAPSKALGEEDRRFMDGLLAKYHNDPSPLLQVLQEINDDRGFLPRVLLEDLALRLETPLAEVLRVVSFYNAFSLEPVGRHTIEICLGTACFVRGSGLLVERLEDLVGVPRGHTGTDMRFTLRTVRCIGCCALAPAMRIDGVTFGKVQLKKLPDLLDEFK